MSLLSSVRSGFVVE